MTKASFNPNGIIIGVDTHKDNHVAFAINSIGHPLGNCTIPATKSGYEQLLSWSKELGECICFGVEGTGSDGKGLTGFLQRQGIRVVEVSRPARRDERRRSGKDDVLDAPASGSSSPVWTSDSHSKNFRRGSRDASTGQDCP